MWLEWGRQGIHTEILWENLLENEHFRSKMWWESNITIDFREKLIGSEWCPGWTQVLVMLKLWILLPYLVKSGY
jgi:hypothetical protein